MQDEFFNEVTADEILAGFESDLETAFWPALNDDASLTDDARAEITVHMEAAEEAIRSARKIISDLPEEA